jgi:phage terminase large subunit-like protein
MRPKKNPDDEKEVQQSYISKTIIEDKANGTAIIEVMKSKVSGIIAFNPGTDSKFERVCVIEPQLEAKNFYIPTKDCATFDVEMYVDNLAKFPNAKKDDLVDMTSMMGIYLKKSLVSFEVF